MFSQLTDSERASLLLDWTADLQVCSVLSKEMNASERNLIHADMGTLPLCSTSID